MSVEIRDARPTDAVALTGLAIRAKSHWGYSRDFIDACRNELTYDTADIADERFRFCVCSYDDQMVGFHAIEFLPPGVCELEALFVEPEFIGRGFGRRLLEHAIGLAKESGAGRLIIQADPHAESFYLAAGAVRTGSRESCSIAGRHLPLFTIALTDYTEAPECRE